MHPSVASYVLYCEYPAGTDMDILNAWGGAARGGTAGVGQQQGVLIPVIYFSLHVVYRTSLVPDPPTRSWNENLKARDPLVQNGIL